MYRSSTPAFSSPQTHNDRSRAKTGFLRQNTSARGATAERLNQEWEEKRWEEAGWITPAPRADAVLQSIRANPDQTLASLISAFQCGHTLAGRVILQALLPKMILLSSRHPYPSVDDLVAALWIRIAGYPLERRPSSVAANLILDAKKDTIHLSRAVPHTEPPQEESGPSAPDVIAVARTLGLATQQSLAIVEDVYIHALPGAEVAALHHTTPAAIRRRCSDTIRRLRTHRQTLAELLSSD